MGRTIFYPVLPSFGTHHHHHHHNNNINNNNSNNSNIQVLLARTTATTATTATTTTRLQGRLRLMFSAVTWAITGFYRVSFFCFCFSSVFIAGDYRVLPGFLFASARCVCVCVCTWSPGSTGFYWVFMGRNVFLTDALTPNTDINQKRNEISTILIRTWKFQEGNRVGPQKRPGNSPWP